MNEPIPVSLALRAVERAIKECDAATPGPWVNGYGDGINGPKTPATTGPTVEEQIDRWDADREGREPRRYHTVVSKGRDTVLIVPGQREEREPVATFSVLARAGFRGTLEYLRLDLTYQREDGSVLDQTAAAVAPLIAHYDRTAPGWRTE